MTSVYLDYNIIVSLFKDEIKINDLTKKLNSDDVQFVYSQAHMLEVANIRDSPNRLRGDIIEEMLKYFDILCKSQFFCSVNLQLVETKLNAVDAFKMVQRSPLTITMIKHLTSRLNESDKKLFRERWELDPNLLNNVKPKNIIEHIDNRMMSVGFEWRFNEMIKYGLETHPSFPNGYGLEQEITAVFALLDIMGYCKDKYHDTSNMSRVFDAQHSYFGSFCDVLVSNDKRMRSKSEVAYDLYNIPTRIISL